MKRILLLLIPALASAFAGDSLKVTVENPHQIELRGVTVEVPLDGAGLEPGSAVGVMGDGSILPAQIEPGPRSPVLVFQTDLPPGGKSEYTLRADAPPAPARVAATAMPAWESERFGFRSYGPMVVDLFARRDANFGLRLSEFYGPDGQAKHDYHKPGPLGMDILHINNTLGLAGVFLSDGKEIAIPRDVPMTSRVLVSGPVRAVVETTLGPWASPWGEATFLRTASIAAGDYGTRLVDRVRFTKPPAQKLFHGVGLRKETGKFGRLDDPGHRTFVHRFQQDEFIGPAGIGLHFPRTIQPVELAEDADNRYFAVPVGEALEAVAFGFWSGEETAAIDDLAAERAGRVRAGQIKPSASISTDRE